jgi:hypothetical protein
MRNSLSRHPRPLIKVGEKGQRGSVEMQGLIFTSKGPTAGVVFVEWNIRASGAGKAGMWGESNLAPGHAGDWTAWLMTTMGSMFRLPCARWRCGRH